MDNEQRAWMGAKGVDPLCEEANTRKAQTTGPGESLCRPAPTFRILDLAFVSPDSKELGISESQGHPKAEASNLESWTWETLGDQARKFL